MQAKYTYGPSDKFAVRVTLVRSVHHFPAIHSCLVCGSYSISLLTTKVSSANLSISVLISTVEANFFADDSDTTSALYSIRKPSTDV